ncbi:MAG: hypothetical protein LBS01_06295 [Prevotellaceae bacterium]|jgi:hypothetical protein|nr:hypothetical protein [Prevotellaceae bacterium]
MKRTTKIYTVIAPVLALMFMFSGCKKEPLIIDRHGAELIVYEFDGGEVEWVAVQKGTSADDKVADAKQDRGDIVRSGDMLYIKLFEIENDTIPFTSTGSYTVVLKHDQKDKMYIKFGVKFEGGLADVKWGGITWLKY